MAPITATDVKKLRDQTGAGMMECKAALTEAGGNFEDANLILRKRGLASAARKAGRATSEGLVGHRVAADRRSGILVEVNCESDFVARTPDFQQLVEDVISEIERAGDGATESWLADPNGPIQKRVAAGIAKLGENMAVRRFVAIRRPDPDELHRTIHPHGRKDRRASRVQPRRSAAGRPRGVRDAGQGNRHADCGSEPVLHVACRRSGRHPRPGEIHLPGAGGRPGETGAGHRQKLSKASSGASTPSSCCPIRHPFAIPR